MESRWGRNFPHLSRPVLGPTQLPIMGTGFFPVVKRPGRGFDHPFHPALRFKKEYSYTSTPPLGLRGLFEAELYLYLYNIFDDHIYIITSTMHAIEVDKITLFKTT